MNVLQIPDGEEMVAMQRFLNLIAYGTDNTRIGDKLYNVFPFNGGVYLSCRDLTPGTGLVWELVVPQCWHDQPEYDEIRGIAATDDRQFVADFFEFVDDYQEVA